MDGSSTKTTEDQLFEAMDRQALRFIEMLDNDTTDEDGVPLYSIELKLKLFDKGQDWLRKRKQLRPPELPGEEPGIRNMREWINDPATRESLRKTLFDAGVVLAPDPKPGRPTREEKVVRDRFKDHKASRADANAPDAGWRDLMPDESEEG